MSLQQQLSRSVCAMQWKHILENTKLSPPNTPFFTSRSYVLFCHVGVAQDTPTTVLLSNQWVTAAAPGRARNADLLYWTAVQWNATSGLPEQIGWKDELVLDLPTRA